MSADFAIGYVGLPYALHGRARPALDCWGLVRLVMLEQAGIELPLWDGLDERSGGECAATISGQAQLWTAVDTSDAKPFDVAVMRGVWRDADRRLHAGDMHCGIVVEGSRVLHVERDSDAVCVPIRRIERRITGVFRHWRMMQ